MSFKKNNFVRISGDFCYNDQTHSFQHYEADGYVSGFYVDSHPYRPGYHYVRIWVYYFKGGECNFDRHDRRQWPACGGHRRDGHYIHEKYITGLWDEADHGLLPENDPKVVKV